MTEKERLWKGKARGRIQKHWLRDAGLASSNHSQASRILSNEVRRVYFEPSFATLRKHDNHRDVEWFHHLPVITCGMKSLRLLLSTVEWNSGRSKVLSTFSWSTADAQLLEVELFVDPLTSMPLLAIPATPMPQGCAFFFSFVQFKWDFALLIWKIFNKEH